MTHPLLRATVPVLLALALTGCSGFQSYRDGQIAATLQDWDEAVAYYMEAVETDPGNIQYRAALLRAKIEASQDHFDKAMEFQEAGVYDRALVELQQAVQLDPTNQYAAVELDNVRDILAAQQANQAYVGSIAEMKDKTRGVRAQPPLLNPRSDEPIDLRFPEPVSIFQIYKALGKAFGINILFDPNLKEQDIPIELEDVDAQTALETLMRAASHFYKVLDEHTILIAADTPQNRRTYEDLVIQTFFLSNAEVKDMLTILRSLVDAKKIATNEQLNAIILRDTADKVKIAERIIESNDKAKAEVVVDVELLQIDTSTLRDLGVRLSEYSVSQSLDLGGEDVPLRLSDLDVLNQSNWVLTVPDFIYQFEKSSTNAQLLAKPRLRITEGEQARLVIGDRVPIPVTTFNTGNTVGGNVVPITSFQYQEVGIQIDIEPRVHHNKEITLKVKVEVSNISGFVQGSGGQQQPRIGTRSIDTTIRLQDGETNLLAGLIRSDETQDEIGVPGLSEIPILGRLFSRKGNDEQRTDVILTLTPHIVRNAEITEQDLVPIWVGTEANLTFRGGSPRVESEVEGPFDAGEGTPEEIQELMRRRIQRLPRGLRQGQGEEGTEEEPPSGQDLVPGLSNPFETPQEEEPPPVVDETENEQEVRLEETPPSLRLPNTESAAESSRVVPASFAEGGSVASAANEASPVRFRLVPRRMEVTSGDAFDVRLRVESDRPVSHLPVTLLYDPERVRVTEVEAGDFLGDESQATVLADTSQPGRLVLGASRLGDAPGVRGSGVVAKITFRAVAPGSTDLRFEAKRSRALGSSLQALAPVDVAPATIQVTPPSVEPLEPVVEPSSLGPKA